MGSSAVPRHWSCLVRRVPFRKETLSGIAAGRPRTGINRQRDLWSIVRIRWMVLSLVSSRAKAVRLGFLATCVLINPVYIEVKDKHLGHFLGESAPLVQLKRALEVVTRVIPTTRLLTSFVQRTFQGLQQTPLVRKEGYRLIFAFDGMNCLVWKRQFFALGGDRQWAFEHMQELGVVKSEMCCNICS